jgi:hypothetical protein
MIRPCGFPPRERWPGQDFRQGKVLQWATKARIPPRRSAARPQLGAPRLAAVGGTDEDDLTQALDPMAMQAAIKAARQGRPALDEARWKKPRRFDPRDDADPHLPRARAPGRRSRSAGPCQARPARRPDARIPRLHRRRAGPQGLRRRAGARMDHVRELVAILQAELLRQGRPRIHAHRRRRGAPLPPGPDRGRGQVDRLHPWARRRSLPP